MRSNPNYCLKIYYFDLMRLPRTPILAALWEGVLFCWIFLMNGWPDVSLLTLLTLTVCLGLRKVIINYSWAWKWAYDELAFVKGFLPPCHIAPPRKNGRPPVFPFPPLGIIDSSKKTTSFSLQFTCFAISRPQQP